MAKFTDMAKEVRGQFVSVAFEDICIETNFNPRSHGVDYQNRVIELAENIKANGQKKPIDIRMDGDKLYLVDGETRYDAIKLLRSQGVDFPFVKALKVEGLDPAQRLIHAISSNDTLPLTKIELGEAYKRLQGYGWDDARIAASAGKNERFVREAIELSNVPEELRNMVLAGTVTDAVVLQQTRAKGSAAVEVIKSKVQEAQANGVTGPLKREKVPTVDDVVKAAEKIARHAVVLEQFEFCRKNNAEAEDTIEVPYHLMTALYKALKMA